ncbi:ABC transporter ATP-binding protein/permease [Patescibacteria group bacterium]|nr:ABC transporter ATP-binding protein/permease [Patescibacteria group bacterium]
MQKKNPFKVLKKYATTKEYILLFVGSFLFLVLLNLQNLAIPKIISSVINEYQQTLQIPTFFYYIVGALAIFSPAASLIQNYLFAILGEKIGTDLRNRLISKVLKQDYNYLVKEKSSKILTVILSDVNYVKSSFIQAIAFAITGSVLLIGSIIMMFSLNAKLATYVVIAVPTFVAILVLVLKNRFKIFKEIQKVRDTLNKVINENIKASMLVRVFVSEKTEIKKFKKQNMLSRNLGIDVTKIFALVIPAISALFYICSLLIIQIGGQEAIAGRLQIGDISAFNLYVLIFVLPLVSLSFMATMLAQSMASLQRISEVLDRDIEFKDGKEPLERINDIHIKKLTFEDDGVNILENINFDLEKEHKIGIMGLTGSGKTLFLKHFLRAVEPTDGEIFINGKDIKEYKSYDLRKEIGFCFQENFLINETIYENIRFGRDIEEKDVLKAAKIADLDEFAKKLEKGYKTIAGEKGNNLSGGQKQRIMIARALVDHPSLLILDDITSRLDANTEGRVFENIKKNYPNISMILVSQKISSLKDCNKIYIFDEGKISESGTHDELLKTSSLYREIELTQSNYDE